MSEKCRIYYFSDMQKCVHCGLCWDANDPHPPACKENPVKHGWLVRLFFKLFWKMIKK